MREIVNAVRCWIDRCQDLVNLHFRANLTNLKPDRLEGVVGQKYVKVVGIDERGHSRVFAFIAIDDTNKIGAKAGDILLPASWQSPAKHARGNVFDEMEGMEFMTYNGPMYLN